MTFITYPESRLSAIRAYAIMMRVELDVAETHIDIIVAALRENCVKEGRLVGVGTIRGEDDSFKIDTTYMTFG